MFITAKTALIDAGAHGRQMPFQCSVQHIGPTGWVTEVTGTNTDYLAEAWNDQKVLWGRARIIITASEFVIFYG